MTNDKQVAVTGNSGNLTTQQIKAIDDLMGKGHSMRKAKRLLGITEKKPMKSRLLMGKNMLDL